ncbi:MAG: hypothetical protein K0R49_1779 [Burkholderiales bacterium]|nr:hypothetical protein [Burkholderiales bacterium]
MRSLKYVGLLCILLTNVYGTEVKNVTTSNSNLNLTPSNLSLNKNDFVFDFSDDLPDIVANNISDVDFEINPIDSFYISPGKQFGGITNTYSDFTDTISIFADREGTEYVADKWNNFLK